MQSGCGDVSGPRWVGVAGRQTGKCISPEGVWVMAVRDYLPRTDAALLAWAQNFSTLVNLNFAAYGITREVASDYQTKQQDFASKLQAATDPLTRGKRTVFLKDEAKKA